MSMPPDIDPQSGNRLPLPRREDLDEARRKSYDHAATPGTSIMGLRGPGGVGLWSKGGPLLQAVTRYLRYEAGISARTREVAILATARELDSQFEWAAHEPEALKEGVPPQVIDVIKRRLSTAGLERIDGAVIDLARQAWRDHKVTSELFAEVKTLFGPAMLVDIVMLMGNYAGTAALLATVDMQLPEGTKPLLPMP
jgi:4-carboxymuconolactone decarboxylase